MFSIKNPAPLPSGWLRYWTMYSRRSSGTLPEHLLSVLGEATVMQFIDNIMSPTCPRPHLLSRTRKGRVRKIQRSQSVHGIVRRSRSIQIDPDQVPGKISCIFRLVYSWNEFRFKFFFVHLLVIYLCQNINYT